VYYRVFLGRFFRMQKASRSGKLLLTLKNFPKLSWEILGFKMEAYAV